MAPAEVDTVYVNGKFAAQRVTGVQRAAGSLVAALDRRLAAAGAGTQSHWVLLHPAGARPPALRCIELRPLGPRGLPLHLWEQALLPLAARGGLLLNLAGSAPALARAQVCNLHDAAVFDTPEAYTALFGGWYRWLFKRLARRARTIVTVSAYSRARLEAALHLDAPGAVVVPNGCDHLDAVVPDTRLLDAHRLRKRPFLLAVGSANRNKNTAALVDAWRGLGRAGDARLVLCGGSHAAVFAAVPGLADAPGVVALGGVDDGTLKALYQHAHGLVFPSLYEGFGLPPLEAMACGCPVTASDAAALPEVCGDAALLFDARAPAALAGALRALLDDAGLRERLRERGRLRAQRFRWDDAAARWLAQVQSLQTVPNEAAR